MMNRSAGILLSVTSLPSKYGIGCFDKAAYDFVDWLARAGQTYWQILPLGATSYGASSDSPYQAYSAFAGNPYFISLDALIEEGVLMQEEVDAVDFGDNADDVDYTKLHEGRFKLLRKAYERSNISHNIEYQQFIRDNHWWLNDYALFMAVHEFFKDQSWTTWPQDIRLRWGYSLDYYRRTLYFDIEFHMYMQFQFARQWKKLKAYANSKNIKIVGDIPIYVSPDGADVWAHPELFQLDDNNQPKAIAGCPPDGFAADGQVWGNPLYRWDYHRVTGYQWWITRMWHSFELYDVVRIDHFRGFDEYFSIPHGAKTAHGGHWEKGPGIDLFNHIKAALGDKAVIAEDLGYMTDSVRQLVKDSGYPNMKVLEFAFDSRDTGAANDYLPHNYGENCVVYTGTHDNETISGWFVGIKEEERKMARDYLCDHYTPDDEIYHAFVSVAMLSKAAACIIPIQDHMGLDNSCRMNQPSTVGKNWRWRVLAEQLTDELADQIAELSMRYGRMNWPAYDTYRRAKKLAEAKAAAEKAAAEKTVKAKADKA